MGACVAPTDCVLEPAQCCAPMCEPVPLSSFTAINQKYVNDWTQRCATVDCIWPPCYLPPPEQRNVKNYIALCEAGRCTAADIRTRDITLCDTSADCYLRVGTGCCESCGSTADQVVAISRKVDAIKTFCGSGLVPCPACMPIIPGNLVAACTAEHRCVVLAVVDAGRAD
jgi:hypothetical protein